MHISEVEKYRMEKEHQMRTGYQQADRNVVNEHAHIFKDTENKHARESRPSDYEIQMEHGQ